MDLEGKIDMILDGGAVDIGLDKRQFVRQARQQGRFYSVRLHLSRTGRPDIDFIAGELDYVAKYAIHKARQLEDSLWSIIGICDMMDTTQATLFRLKL